MQVYIDEGEGQIILLALAVLALRRPGWDWMLGNLSERLHGRETFEQLKESLRESPA